MDAPTEVHPRRDTVWLAEDAGEFDRFLASLEAAEERDHCPRASYVERGVPAYEGGMVRTAAGLPDARRELMAEWVGVLSEGAGIIIIKNALEDENVVDAATGVFERLILDERAAGAGAGDHFAKAGANDRVWNALEKHCRADPENFARYYAADAVAMASEAWLGRGYQMTAQINRVNPGGAAQTAHRDYHLGFMTPAQMAAFPAHVHGVSPLLTLQGAIAHCDMPLASGPTLFLPGSQRFSEGYLAFGRAPFRAHFEAHHVQLPLEKGDAVFFNPAVMHGAGENQTEDVHRMANLLQVSSPFGRAMESVDRTAMVELLYPELRLALQSGALSELGVRNVIAASAEGYAFPTNLDRDPPVGGLAPQTQAELLWEAVQEGWDADKATEAFRDQASRRQA